MARWMREAKPSFVMAPKDHARIWPANFANSVTYALDSSGRIVAEPKSEGMKKRGLRSPDLADALGVTFAPGKRANKVIVQAYRGGF